MNTDMQALRIAVENRIKQVQRDISSLHHHQGEEHHGFTGQKHALMWVLNEITFLRNLSNKSETKGKEPHSALKVLRMVAHQLHQLAEARELLKLITGDARKINGNHDDYLIRIDLVELAINRMEGE